ncbi:hypothetical protein Syun_002266 [Stephania yunnanensis]|uniref:Uncharacterized protein n=1 Tax=Stephania yunnanensis TaxID=152371 RepID=A0AAP0QBN7_9MAGN
MVKMRRFNYPGNFFLLEGKTLGSFHLLLEKVRSCVEGINKAEIGEGDNKMDGQKTRVEASKMKGNNISKRPQGKGKGVANKQNDRWNKSHYPGSKGKQNDKGVSV